MIARALFNVIEIIQILCFIIFLGASRPTTLAPTTTVAPCVSRNVTKFLKRGQTHTEVEVSGDTVLKLEAGEHSFATEKDGANCTVHIRVLRGNETQHLFYPLFS